MARNDLNHGRASSTALRLRRARRKSPLRTPERRVVVVDEHPMVADWFDRMFGARTNLKVCARVDSVEAAVATIAKHEPDIVITELRLKDRRGAEVVRVIKSRFRQIPLLVLSALPEAMCAEAVIEAGANGYISKCEPGATVMMAIRKVLAGEVFVSPMVTEAMLQALRSGTAPGSRSPLVVLSPRELQLLRLVGLGCRPKEIARELNLSVRTVESYGIRIRQKLSLESAHHLFRAAVAWVAASGG